MDTQKTVQVDIVIFGGGIAGLWALNRLRRLGYQAVLLESHALGGGQTLKSQGIIHGGLKYALTGFLTGSANAVEAMPNRWKAALAGTGEINLQNVRILSHDQLLCSTGRLQSELTNFFASKTLRSRTRKLPKKHYPPILQNPAFKGNVYRLEEIVLDTRSLVETLVMPYQDYLFKINSEQGYHFDRSAENPHNIGSLIITSGNNTLRLQAKRYLFTAGAGNSTLLQTFENAPKMQMRPLHMALVKLKKPAPFFAHCIEHGQNPTLTITSHQTCLGDFVWYLGGQLAENGIQYSQGEQIALAKKTLNRLFPWVDLNSAEWGSFFVNRAEPAQPMGKRPETAWLKTLGNIIIAWPTKLALAPLLSDYLIAQLQHDKITPSSAEALETPEFMTLEKPTIAAAPWEHVHWKHA